MDSKETKEIKETNEQISDSLGICTKDHTNGSLFGERLTPFAYMCID